MATPPPRTWVYFSSSDNVAIFGASQLPNEAKVSRYRVDSSNVLRGDAVANFKPGAEIVRVCSNEPLDECADRAPPLSGCTQHLHYTSDMQRERLVAISAKEIPAAEKPVTVLIPIRKSDAWWSMGQNARAEFMNGAAAHRGHTAIGEEYAALIFRQLLHARYLDSSKKPYDFLTYFEFRDADREWFKGLLNRLRDEAINPEWAFVEMEQEIWMRKME